MQINTVARAHAYNINFDDTICVLITASVSTLLNMALINFQYAKIIITQPSIEIIKNGRNRNPALATAENKYNLEIPLNWRIMITNDHDFICQLVPVEELLHFEHQTAIFNPFYIGIPKIVNISIKSVNQTAIEHFVPKLPKKNLLVMPLGKSSDWDNRIVNPETHEESFYPDCIMLCDDIDTSKCELELYEDIIGN